MAEHDRTKVLAASCLRVLSEDPELLHKLPAVLPQLVQGRASHFRASTFSAQLQPL